MNITDVTESDHVNSCQNHLLNGRVGHDFIRDVKSELVYGKRRLHSAGTTPRIDIALNIEDATILFINGLLHDTLEIFIYTLDKPLL